MSREERMDKIWVCVRRALTDQDTERFVTLLEDLENVDDISDITATLSPERAERQLYIAVPALLRS